MRFLTKLGQVLLKVTSIISGVGPLFPQYSKELDKTLITLGHIGGIVVNVEAFGQVLGTSGPDKLKAASPLVAQLILRSDLLVGRKIDNPALFQSGVTKITDGMADILNSLDDKIEVEDKA